MCPDFLGGAKNNQCDGWHGGTGQMGAQAYFLIRTMILAFFGEFDPLNMYAREEDEVGRAIQ